MQKPLIFILILVFTYTFYPGYTSAQKMSGKEKKVLVKELKGLYQNVEQYKAMKDKFNAQKKEYLEMDKEMQRKKKELKEMNVKLAELIKEEERLIAEKKRIEDALKSGKFSSDMVAERPDMKGTWYRVQFEPAKADFAGLDKKMINGKEELVYTGDTDQDGTKKYTIAYFNNENQAYEFDKILKSLKIKSKVVKYENGQKK